MGNTRMGGTHQVHPGETVSAIFLLTLRAKDGREMHMAAYLPTNEVRRHFFEKAKQNGLQVIIHNNPKS